ncbi:leukotoxin LktA family filamentous adhesin, partial [Alkalilacustris brevis]|uniref:leukotoxin LktA family filamentous adhesin n=1 Tax=Alkalilacustris brevis TaxID=2026338 RepID=UPI000E0D79D9
MRERFKIMVALLSSTAVALSPAVAMASGGIVADGRTDTSIVNSGNITDITTDTIRGGNAFNSFERFSVEQLQTVNLHQPEVAGALINVIRNGVTNIEGTLNTLQGGEIGGNVFMVSPDGMVVGAGGVINTGNLTVSTATHGFADRLIGPGGMIDDSAVAQLFAGGEPLSAHGAIELYGEINARRLELRAGARMLLDGRINVIDSTGEQTAAPAVNTDGAESASGVTVSGGVIRLHSGGDMSVSGQATARSGDDGGRIAMTAGGDIDVHAGADISADGVGDGHGGLVYLFADGSALLEEGARIGASAVAGDGGFIEFSARERVSFGGTLDATSQEGRAGVVYIDPAVIEVTADVYTGGATWILEADERITVDNGVTISTRQIAGGAGGDQAGANSTGSSGDLIITAPIIDVDGANLYAHSDSDDYDGGLIALLARAEGDATSGLVAFDDSVARISITDATLHGGAIYIGAYAQAEGAIAPDSSASGSDGFLKAVLDVGLDLTGKLISGDGLETRDYIQAINDLAEPYGDKIPIQVAYLTADAEISIIGSSLTADGNWSGMTPSDGFDTSATSLADNGVLTPDGLAESEYEFSADHDDADVDSDGQPDSFTARLAHAFDTSGDAIYIHAHAQTDVNIEPGSDPLNLLVAITDTTSRVTITDTTLISGSGDIVVNSTATENVSTSLDPKSYKDIAAGITISVRDLTNQVLVNGGSIDAAGDLTVQALTGLNHHLTTEADAGKEGKFALATSVSIGNTLTEAVLGGDITTGGDLNLLAETLYFRKEHTTGATLGVDEPPEAADASEEDDADDANNDLFGFMNSFKDKILGQDNGDAGTASSDFGIMSEGSGNDESEKPGFAGALAVDISLDNNDTFATLGGQYRDLDDDRALVDLAATPVTAGGAIDVNAVLRFAAKNTDEDDPATGEGGQGLLRAVTSDVASLTEAMKEQLQEYNDSVGQDDQKTEEEFIGDFGYGVFLNVPVASMTGVTQAELGGNLNVTGATSVNVQARTAYQNARPWEQSLSELLKDYIEQVASDFASPERDEAYDPENLPDPFEDPQQTLDNFFNLPDYLTTRVGAGAETPSDSEESDQQLAIGVTVNYFNTVRRRMIWDSRRDFGLEGSGSV